MPAPVVASIGVMGLVIGVVGARGGAGASLLAASLAVEWGSVGDTTGSGRSAVVDLSRGAGLDVLLGIEEQPGARWPDLHQARGAVDGAELRAVLPTWHDVGVLSSDRLRPRPAPADVVSDVLDALTDEHDVVVLDLDRADLLRADRCPAVGRCTTILLVAPLDLRAVAGGVALRGALDVQANDVRLVLRGPSPGGLGAAEVAHVLGLPLAGSIPYRRRLDAAVEAGLGPPHRGAYARAVRRLARELT